MNVKISQETVNEHAFPKSKGLKIRCPKKIHIYDSSLVKYLVNII